ncbi:hypothetical protein ACIPC1_11310 [Streptomyces sp. NPDC087263]|uniref:hypothetical protein n=1 Tax=Streptomyces sp. NPDC087263 TaxID=3365773 RepID=UPI00381D0C97
MGFAVFMSLPGLILLPRVPAFADRLLRGDNEDGAPPNRTAVDLYGRMAVVRMPRAARRERP